MKKTKWIIATAALALFTSGCSSAEEDYKFVKSEREKIDHIHDAGSQIVKMIFSSPLMRA